MNSVKLKYYVKYMGLIWERKKIYFSRKPIHLADMTFFLMMPRKERLFLSLEDRKIKLNKYAKNYFGVG